MKIEKLPCPCGYKGLDGKGHCHKYILPPLINASEASVSSETADEVIQAFADAEKFRWMIKNMTKAAAAKYLPEGKRVDFINSLMIRDVVDGKG